MELKNEQKICEENFTIDNIPRCIECNLVASLKLKYKNGKPLINYFCENKHKGEITLEEYYQKCFKFSLSKQNCDECKKNLIKLYCSKCNKFLCPSCSDKHQQDQNKHNLNNFNRYDSICKIHHNFFDNYCDTCKLNICIYCKNEHESHNLKDLSKFVYSDEDKNKLYEEINNMEIKIKNLDVIKKELIKRIDSLKNSSELEMKFIKILLNSYKYEENQNNLNYNVIQNLKNFEKIFKSNKINIYNKIYNEGNKFISFFDKIKNYHLNSFKNNFKNLENHKHYISYLSKLKDGRLASCSCDGSLNIYKKDTFDLQFSLKLHQSNVRSFTQINDERIITCGKDCTMKIIRLLDEKDYHLDQELKDHSGKVYKIIEIKKNELISVSADNTMIIWKLNNQNKFICDKKVKFQNSSTNCNILKLNDKEFATCSCGDKCIKFFNSKNYSEIPNSIINNINTFYGKNLCLLDEDTLCVCGYNSKGFYLIRISNHQLIKNINIDNANTIYSIHECIDGLFLCSIIDDKSNNNLVRYKYENEKFEKIEEKIKASDNRIFACVELDEGIFASGGYGDNYQIKLWSYED